MSSWAGLFCTSLAAAAACEGRDASELVVDLRTDLTPGVELTFVRVDTLDAEATSVVDTRWLQVTTSCPIGADGLFDLGSHLVGRGVRSETPLRWTAFGSDGEGRAVKLLERRVDAAFREGPLSFSVFLGRTCRDKACSAGETCEAATGTCQAVPRIDVPAAAGTSGLGPYCLNRWDAPPMLAPPPEDDASMPGAPDAGPAAFDCRGGDGHCPYGCHGDRDPDCLLPNKKYCDSTTELCNGGPCQNNVCCDRACGECERCDLPGSEGRCTKIPYALTPAPHNARDLVLTCTDDHVIVSCANGTCVPDCMKGFGACGDMQKTGCETPVGTKDNCKGCGDVCVYGYCDTSNADAACTWHGTQQIPSDGFAMLEAGSLYATMYVPTSTADTKLRALGVLVDSTFAGGSVRLAMYEASSQGVPFTRLVQTEAVPAEDNPASKVPAASRMKRVEVPISADVNVAKQYYLGIQVSQSMLIASSAKPSFLTWKVAPQMFGEFPAYFPFPFTENMGPLLSVYAVTTPY